MSDYYVPEVICHKVEVMIGNRKQRDLRMFAYENEMLCLKLLLWMRANHIISYLPLPLPEAGQQKVEKQSFGGIFLPIEVQGVSQSDQ